MANMKLFERVKIGNVTLPNRVGLAPMGMRTSDGSFQDNTCRYYQRVARGGTGLIITGNAMATTGFEPRSNYLLEDFQQICALAKAAEFVHYEGSKIFLQIGPGLGRVGHKDPKNPPHAPSAIDAKFFPGVLCTPFTTEEIARLVAAVARTAKFAKTAGCDGCEIHAYGGYLVDQFLTRKWNKREDRYGGDLKGRMTFLFEILDAIRAAVGEDFPIIVKVTVDHCMPEDPEMRTLEEGLEMCRLLKEHGNFDALHVDRGCYEKYYYQIPTVYEPKGINIEACKKVKEVMGDSGIEEPSATDTLEPYQRPGRLRIPALRPQSARGFDGLDLPEYPHWRRGKSGCPVWPDKTDGSASLREYAYMGGHPFSPAPSRSAAVGSGQSGVSSSRPV